jgi:hypothetical protein
MTMENKTEKQAPPCLNLRYKQMFYKDVSAPPTEVELEMKRVYGAWDATAYWCSCTQDGRGPDDQAVNKESCSRKGRACYKDLSSLE